MYKFKNKKSILIVLIITILFIINGCSKNAPEGVVATVNKEDISIENFDKEYQIQANTMENRLGEGVLDQKGTSGNLVKDELKEKILNILIIEELISQDANEKEITVSDEDVNKGIEDIKEGMGGEEKLKEYQEAVGMDDEYLNIFVKKNILLEKHKENYTNDLKLEDKEIEGFFNENKESLTLVKARQILLETEEEGKNLLKRLKDGEDFKTLAIENSKDPDTALEGGELGYFARGKNPKEFDKVVFGLGKGDISPLIETEIGYHIVEIQEIKDTFKSLKDEVTYFANENKYAEYLESLQNDAKVEVYLEQNSKDKK